MKPFLLALALTLAACTQATQPVAAPNGFQAGGYAPDTTLCCPDGYRCRYRPTLGANQYGSFWWCVRDTDTTIHEQPEKCP